jgi:hypothetical protein
VLIRRFAWWDIPEALRLRNEVLGLDTTRLLTGGNPLEGLGLVRHWSPFHQVCSVIAYGERPILGGISCNGEGELAHLLYLAPLSHLDTSALSLVLEALLEQALEWGALYVLAEVEASHPLLDAFRRLRFSVALWETFWELPETQPKDTSWEAIRGGVQRGNFFSLYHQLVPPMLQGIEHPGKRRQRIYALNAWGYALVSAGAHGTVVTPLFHPDMPEPLDALRHLASLLQARYHRSLYLRLPSYQSWLESALEQVGARFLSRQALLIHHLAKVEFEKESLPAASALRTQPSPPLIPTPLSGKSPGK